MSVTEMPEILGFIAISQQVQVMHDDEAKWLIEALDAAIEKAVKKSVKFRKKSELNIKLQFTPGQMNQMKIEAMINAVEPKPDTLPMLAYTDNKGRLHGEDPNQTKIPFDRTVEMRKAD